MATGATLGSLVLALRGELLQSVSALHGVNSDPAYRTIIARGQRHLWRDFPWPHLEVTADVELAAGQRYYDLPTTIALDRIACVDLKYGGTWRPLERGIGVEQYNASDSDADVRGDPARRWDSYQEAQFEVWPMPAADDAQVVRFRGTRGLNALVNDSDTADLDEDLLVLYAAAEIAAENKSPRAGEIARRFTLLYNKLRAGGDANTAGRFSLGGDTAPRTFKRPTPLVAVDRGN